MGGTKTSFHNSVKILGGMISDQHLNWKAHILSIKAIDTCALSLIKNCPIIHGLPNVRPWECFVESLFFP